MGNLFGLGLHLLGGAVVEPMSGTGLHQLLASPAPTPKGLSSWARFPVELSFWKVLLCPQLLLYALFLAKPLGRSPPGPPLRPGPRGHHR